MEKIKKLYKKAKQIFEKIKFNTIPIFNYLPDKVFIWYQKKKILFYGLFLSVLLATMFLFVKPLVHIKYNNYGSLAEWVSGVITAGGIIYSINLNRKNSELHFKFTSYLTNRKDSKEERELTYTVTNKSNINYYPRVFVQAIGLSIRRRPWKSSEMQKQYDFYIKRDNNTIELSDGEMKFATMAKPKEGFCWAHVPDFKNTKYFYAVPFVVAMDGGIYYSEEYQKYKFSDIEIVF